MENLLHSTANATGWLLTELPPFPGGIGSEELYFVGSGADMDTSKHVDRMQIIREVTLEMLELYRLRLEEAGYRTVFSRREGKLHCMQLSGNDRLVYVYYAEPWGEARVISEEQTVSVPEFESICPTGEAKPLALYQYAMMFNRNGNGNRKGDPYGNCGMFYIIRLADNSLILIDGGDVRQATERAAAALVPFLREITGTAEGERIRISAIFISHPHDDHKRFLNRLVESYSDQIEIGGAIYNIPVSSHPCFPAFGATLTKTFPDLKYLRPHTGMKLSMGGVEIEVVAAHEDMADAVSGKSIVTESNNLSTALKLTLNGKTVMLLTDWGGGHTVAPPEYATLEPRFLALWDESYLHCDAIQVTHHALNPYMGKINAAIAPTYAFFPAADVCMENQAHPNVVNVNYDQLMAAGCDPDRVYFSSRYTYCFHVDTDGRVTVAAEHIRGADLEDDPTTSNLDRHGVPQEYLKEQDYVNETLKAYPPYRVPTDEEFASWKILHS